MDPFTYNQIRNENPQLLLPLWAEMWAGAHDEVLRLDAQELIAQRSAALLVRHPGVMLCDVWPEITNFPV